MHAKGSVAFSCLVLVLLASNGQLFAATPSTAEIVRVSVAGDGSQANRDSFTASISADGRFVAFSSYADNLVAGVVSTPGGIYVRDLLGGQTARVSIASDGTPGNSVSFAPEITPDGRYVAFSSSASNLIPGDNGLADMFVHDRSTATTVLVSVASNGTRANDESFGSSISADGRFVVFMSKATNLGAVASPYDDIFLHDRDTDSDVVFDEPGAIGTQLVSIGYDGSAAVGNSGAPVISADGRFVAYISNAKNLTTQPTSSALDTFVWDRSSGSTLLVSRAPQTRTDFAVERPAISANGRYIAYGRSGQVYMFDRQTEQTKLLSAAPDGKPGDNYTTAPHMTADGRFVVFESNSTNLLATAPDWNKAALAYDRDVDADGVFDEPAGVSTTYIARAADGLQTPVSGMGPVLSSNGRFVTFRSEASSLVPDDTGGNADIFVKDRQRVSFSAAGVDTREEAKLVTISVSRAAFDGASSVGYATGDSTARAGLDYVATSGTLTFGPGETEKQFTVALLDDLIPEGERSFVARLSGVTNGVLGTPNAIAIRILRSDTYIQLVPLANK